MNKAILITGIAGSGKSSLCDELKKLGHNAYDIEYINGLFAFVDKITGKSYDIEHINGLFALVDRMTGKIADDCDIDDLKFIKQSAWLCDKKKLQQLVRRNSKGIVFYCGTASNINDLLPMFDKIFLLKASQKVLRKRLNARGGFGRTPEIQKWIFSRKKQLEDQMSERGAIVIDASQSPQEIAMDIVERSKSSE